MAARQRRAIYQRAVLISNATLLMCITRPAASVADVVDAVMDLAVHGILRPRAGVSGSSQPPTPRLFGCAAEICATDQNNRGEAEVTTRACGQGRTWILPPVMGTWVVGLPNR